MSVILNYASKFQIGPVESFDRTEKVEKELIAYLKKLKADGEISSNDFDRIKVADYPKIR